MFESIQWPDLTRKRPREDEEEAEMMNGMTGFTEHRNKRLHSLPFRTSPSQKRWSVPPSFPASQMPPSTITPADSDSEDLHQPQSHFSPWSSSPNLVQPQQHSPSAAMDMDRDMDMMATEPAYDSSQHLQPGPSQPDPVASSITGRMPTPIHPTFASQIRGNSWGSIHQGVVDMDTSGGSVASVPLAFPAPRDPSVPRSLDTVPEWTMVQNRRLPSPISESGGEEAPISPGMVLDSASPSLQRPYLPHLPHSTNPAMALHPNLEVVTRSLADADMGMETDQQQEAHSPTSAPATPSPRGKFGHSRSKHTLNNWTMQSGMKKSFSIGYRADCDKCRQKVPGHFNHIIIS